ncbi:MAG: hypothetical protein GY754_38000, partial [bacterium]|nr:hypothetical protein [bacterium]
KKEKSNTAALLDHFLKGFSENNNSYSIHYLYNESDDMLKEHFSNSETVLFASPIYLNTLPARGFEFIEKLEDLCGNNNNPDILFFIQCAFLETVHMRNTEKYLRKLSKRLNSKYFGTIIKSGSGLFINDLPGFLKKKMFKMFYELGKDFGSNYSLDEKKLKKMAKPDVIPVILRKVFITFMNAIFLKSLFTKTNSYEKRFNAPYAPEAE